MLVGKRRATLLVLLLFCVGCTIDIEEHIAGNYFFNSDGEYSSFITAKTNHGANIILDKSVLGFDTDGKRILVARQVMEDFECADGSIIPRVDAFITFYLISTISKDIDILESKRLGDKAWEFSYENLKLTSGSLKINTLEFNDLSDCRSPKKIRY